MYYHDICLFSFVKFYPVQLLAVISKIYSTVPIHLHVPIAKKVVNDNLRLVDFQSWLLHEMDSVLNLPDTHFY